jgi:5S rRNA maturation endonuclease (ribonuclease M5)
MIDKRLGNAKDPNDSIYSNDPDYRWDDSSQNVHNHRWRRIKGHNGAKAIAIAELNKRRDNYKSIEFVSQNSFYYFLRKIFLKNGINPEAEGKEFRKSLTSSIAEWCEEIGTTREDLKIYASSRAYLYHRGARTAVSLRNIERLALLGTDIIIIEKEDIAHLLHPYTDAAGIAILDSKGFVVKYASKVSRIARKYGCNIAMLTDLDADGIFMTMKVKQLIPSLFRIGINFKTLEHFKIDADVAGESYSGRTMIILDKIRVPEDIATAEELEFIRTRRIEIDSVTNEVNDNKKFAEYIIKTLVKRFKTRDYTRAIGVKDYAYPSVLDDLTRILREKSKSVVENRVEEIEAALEEYEGVVENVDTEEEAFDDELTNQVDEITGIDEETGAHRAEHFIVHYDYIKLVDKIQEIVNEFDNDYDDDELESEEE